MKIQDIVNTKQGQDAIVAIDHILCPIYDENRNELTEEELNFCYIEELERQINSGGFNSYFYYDYGNYVNETLSALEKIGSKTYTNILKAAIEVFDGAYVFDHYKRSDLIDEHEEHYDETWQVLDERFYQYEENIHDLLLSYVKNNIANFR